MADAALTETEVELARVAYEDKWQLALSQRVNPLQGTFANQDIKAKQTFWDTVGEIELEETTDPYASVNPVSPDLGRRMITWDMFHKALAIEESAIRKARDSSPAWMPELAAAAARKEISKMITAFEATAKGGQDGTTDYAFGSTSVLSGGQVIPADLNDDGSGVTGTAKGMSARKIKFLKKYGIKRKFPMNSRLHCLISEEELEDLEGDDLFINSDYAGTTRFEDGVIQKFMWRGVNFTVLPTEYMTTDTSVSGGGVGTVRFCYFWFEEAMKFGYVKNADVRIDDIGNRVASNSARQMKLNHWFGVTRAYDTGVFRVETAQ